MTVNSICLVSLWFALIIPQAGWGQDHLKLVTYNLHGGHGNPEANLQLFKELLDGDEQVLCLQELKPDMWQLVQDTFPAYRNTQVVWRETTDELNLFEQRQREGNALLSKLPIIEQSERLVQIDPAGDLWERKAGFVRLQTGAQAGESVLLAHYHNTYNFDENDFAAEQEGLRLFRDMAIQELDLGSLASTAPYILAGDFNVMQDKVASILGEAPYHYGVWRDHIVTNIAPLETYRLDTSTRDISDHDALVAVLDLEVNISEYEGDEGRVEQDQNSQAGATPSFFWWLLLIGIVLARRNAVIGTVDQWL